MEAAEPIYVTLASIDRPKLPPPSMLKDRSKKPVQKQESEPQATTGPSRNLRKRPRSGDPYAISQEQHRSIDHLVELRETRDLMRNSSARILDLEKELAEERKTSSELRSIPRISLDLEEFSDEEPDPSAKEPLPTVNELSSSDEDRKYGDDENAETDENHEDDDDEDSGSDEDHEDGD
ncbi:glutamic acid-rich protein-like [Papaver somniferum]|uniref:glutamic acid-rich protein-like n=1 Tax=Papaver somniferum TaxID=3469 RepID=UPI000E6F9EDB|nr:glutamic acid-rich protein-like [Papaver somniferum]